MYKNMHENARLHKNSTCVCIHVLASILILFKSEDNIQHVKLIKSRIVIKNPLTVHCIYPYIGACKFICRV